MPTLYKCEKCNPPSPPKPKPKPKPSQKKHSPPNKKKFNFKKGTIVSAKNMKHHWQRKRNVLK